MPLSKLFSSQKSQTAQLAASIFNQYAPAVSSVSHHPPSTHSDLHLLLFSRVSAVCVCVRVRVSCVLCCIVCCVVCALPRCPMSVSGTFALHPLLRQRNGCTVRIDEVNQFFYGQHGSVRPHHHTTPHTTT